MPRISQLVFVCAAALASCSEPDSSPSPDVVDAGAKESQAAKADLGTDRPKGRFRTRQPSSATDEEYDELSAIGYSAGTQEAPAQSGVTVHLPKAVSAGFNFFVSGHEASALLMDMEGQVLHRWYAEFETIWPDHADVSDRADSKFWRRAHLFPNGDVIAIFESLGIVKLDRNSVVLWAKAIQTHHDLQVLDNGEVVVLGRRITREPTAAETVGKLSDARIESKRDSRRSILQDFVLSFDSEPDPLTSLSIYKCFENSDPEHGWKGPALDFWSKEPERSMTGSHRDIFHTNSVEVLDGRIAERVPEFKAGNYLVSLRHLDMIAVVDPGLRKVVWSMTGASTLQHDAQITSDGHLLYFDNQWRPGKTRIVIMDLLTREPVWEYGTQPGQELYSETCGTVQELPNRNLLITETDGGRVIEVTPAGNVVWEYFNPYGVGENDELIASLFEMVRLGPDFPTDWLESAAR